MKKITYFLAFLSLLYINASSAQKIKVSLSSELNRLCDIRQLPKYINDSYEAQRSSYDTTGGNDDGFSGKYSYIRKNADGSLVIFEAKGMGVINRIWTPTPNDDILDLYFDGAAKPSYSIKFSDLFSGKVFPFIKPLCDNQLGGYFCYLPIPFQHGCKIVSRGKMMQFYQVQYRYYGDGYEVRSFDPNLSVQEKETLEKVKKLWETGRKTVKELYPGNSKVVNTTTRLKPGTSTTLLDLKKGGRIVGIEIDPANAFSGVNKQIDLKISWDSEQVPAVYAPLADFFGYAFGSPSMQSLLLGSVNNKNYCYFPMPFDRAAKIELIYRKPDNGVVTTAKTIHAKVYYTNEKRDPATEGKFYTSWKRDLNIATGKPYIYLQAKGKGHYVGTVLLSQGIRPGMTIFFEGDDSTATDGVTRIHGTGSEDSFNGGWYALMDRWDTKMSLPLHGALDYSLPLSHTGGYRLYLNDKISFSRSISQSIEHGPEGNKVPADYTSVALYYSDTPLSTYIKPTNKLTALHAPDTLVMYPQLMDFSFWGDVSVKTGFDGYTFTASNDAEMRISIPEIPYGNYKLYADAGKGPQAADISIWQRQSKVSEDISLSAEKPFAANQLYLCDIIVGDFKNTLTIHFKASGEHNRLLLRRFIFVKN